MIPKVSVCVVTYNHEMYIKQCLDSILTQETSFEVEIIVGEDCSTDGTRKIVQEYAARYSSKIILILHSRNIGPLENVIAVHERASGEYVAQIDGDDYMLPNKIEKQVRFLEENGDCSFVAHQKITVSDGGEVICDRCKQHPVKTNIAYLVKNQMFFTNSSVMYRKILRDGKSWMHLKPVIDYTIHLEDASKGLVGFINEPLVAYRVNPNSLSRSRGHKMYQLFDMTLDAFARAVELGVDKDLVDNSFQYYLFKSALYFLDRGDFEGYRKYSNQFHREKGRRRMGICVLQFISRFRYSFIIWLFLLKARKVVKNLKYSRVY